MTKRLKRPIAFMLAVVMAMMINLPLEGTSFLTTANAYEGVTFTALSGTSGVNTSENYDKLFDGDTGTKWCVTQFKSANVIFQASEAIKLSGYTITTGNDTEKNPSRNPKDWTLYGCNDYTGSGTGTWEAIHQVTDDTVMEIKNLTKYVFAFDMTEETYQYFKLVVTKNTGSEACIQISEFELTDCEHQWELIEESVVDCVNDGYTVHKCTVCQGQKKTITEAAWGHTLGDDSICDVCGAADTTPKKPTNGDGSLDSPYQISTASELYWFAGLVNGDSSVCTGDVVQNKAANAVLTADILVNPNVLKADGSFNSGNFESWTPIGNYSNKYTGTFDGQKHTISGLYFNDTSKSNVGLFGYTGSGSSITNINIKDSCFRGNSYVGGLCGYNYSTVNNCSVKAYIEGNTRIGGIAAINYGTIENCYTEVSLKGTSSNTYSYGVSYNYTSSYTSKNCLSVINIPEGFLGYLYGTSSSYSTNNYYLINGYNSRVIVYSVSSSTEVNTETLASGKIAYLLNNSSSDDTVVWRQDLSAENSVPTLNGTDPIVYYKYYNSCVPVYTNSTDEGEQLDHNYVDGICQNGCGVPEKVSNYYQIYNKEQLLTFADYCKDCSSSNYVYGKLMADIDLSSVTNWFPIGNGSGYYYGTFDGNGHTISNVNCVNSDAGLFKCNYGTIKNLRVVDSYFEGNNYVGAISAKNYGGTINNCYTDVTLKGTSTNAYICGISSTNFSGYYLKNNLSVINIAEGSLGSHYAVSDDYITNCYYMINSNVSDVAVSSTGTHEVTAEDLACGKTAYLLNSGSTGSSAVWRQDISVSNSLPIPDSTGSIVYRKYNNTCIPTYTNDSGLAGYSDTPTHNYVNGICQNGCNEPEKVEDVYQIYNEEQLLTFAEYGINSSSSNLINGKLMADINLSSVSDWTPIGNGNGEYYGTFDGDGHTISGINCVDIYAGLFKYNYGTIKNLRVVDSYFEGSIYIGAISARNYRTIENCYSDVTLKGTSSNAYISGICNNYSSSYPIYNCLAVINIAEGSTGYHYGVSNNYIINSYYKVNSNNAGVTVNAGGAEGVTDDDLTSGKITYLLNNSLSDDTVVWRQDLSAADSVPTPDSTGSIVYAQYDNSCIPALYTNEKEVSGYSNTPIHNFVDGVCQYGCGELENTEDVYLICNVEQLFKFVEYLEECSSSNPINGKLMADIDLSSYSSWTPMGNFSGKYYGTFDGNGYTISGISCNNSYAGLFKYNYGTIKNLSVKGNFTGYSYIAGVAAQNYGVIENCYAEVTLKGTSSSTDSCGISYSSYSSSVRNCLAKITIPSGSNGRYYGISNSYNNNSYYIIDSNAASVTVNAGGANEAADEDLTSGKITYLLNKSLSDDTVVWRQDLSDETYLPSPNITGPIVYAKYNNTCIPIYTNDGDLAGYSDTPVHNYVNGVCQNGCGEMVREGDVYLIYDADQLLTFAGYCKDSDSSNSVSGKLMADIDLSSVENWTPIANSSGRYYGTFDGNGYTISGISCNNSYAGLFKYNYGTIKNLSVKGYFEGSAYIAGVSARNYGVIENCYAEVTLKGTSSSTNSCGISYSSSSDSSAYTRNCLAVITIAEGSIGRHYGVSYSRNTNNYYVVAANYADVTVSGGTSVTAEDVSSGKITYLLNGSKSTGEVVWRQDLSDENSRPTPDSRGPVVILSDDTYTNKPLISGDVNNDDAVDKADAALILKYVSGITNTLPNISAADYNGDTKTDILDVVAILKIAA